MKKNSYLLSCLAIAVSSACHAEVLTYPDPLGSSQSDFGGTGLLQMPNARIAPEGEFSVNYRDNDQYRFYSTSVALVPWLEGTIRYTDVRTRKYSQWEDFSGDQSYKDNHSILNFACGKKVTGYRKWRLVNVILLVRVCLTVSIWWPASKRGHLISPSGWHGATPVMRAILPTRFAG